MESDLNRLAEIFSWVSVQPHYTGKDEPKFDGWTITMKTSEGVCFYVTAASLPEAVMMALHRHDPAHVHHDPIPRRKIKIKR